MGNLAGNFDNHAPYIAVTGGILKLAGLETLLGTPVVPWHPRKAWVGPAKAVIGWGRKPSALVAAKFADYCGLALISLEDGFLRSVGLGADEPVLSIVVDDLGIYYDALMPSQFERWVAQPLTTQQCLRAQHIRAAWCQARVSKYNHAREYTRPLPERYVLVADQVEGDLSIHYGMAAQANFDRMLAAALLENPDCTVLLKIHPGVISNRKRGHFDLAALAGNPRVHIISEALHPVSLLQHARAIYCVTSQIGFEGLLWGKPVRTFGMPFYAGWGLTQDELAAPSRRYPVALENLVYAALLAYPRYIDPETGQRCEAERVVAWLGLQRKMRERFPQVVDAIGFSAYKSRYKRPTVRRFFQGSHVFFDRDLNAMPAHPMLAVWRCEAAEPALISHDSANVVQLEDGFIRSVGLGADMVEPLSWAMDSRGIYYDASRPSDLEHILQHRAFDQELLDRAASLRARLVAEGLTKYNIGTGEWRRPKNLQRVILVPGQVEADASIALGALDIRTNLALLKTVRAHNPNAFILYKPHPDVVAGLRANTPDHDELADWCDDIAVDVSMAQLLLSVDEVHTITSLAGFEALLRGKKTVCYGLPFYAGWGLTEDAHSLERRTRRLTLDELVAGALILYPTYISRTTGRFTTPERTLDELLAWRETAGTAVPKWRHGIRLVLHVEKAINGHWR